MTLICLPVRRRASSIWVVMTGTSDWFRLTSSPCASLICWMMGSLEASGWLDAPPFSDEAPPPLDELPPAPPWLTITVTMLDESPLETMMEVERCPQR